MRNILVECHPFDAKTNQTVVVRLSSSWADQSGTYIDGKFWLPVITSGPVFTGSIWSNGQPQALDITYGNLGLKISADFSNLNYQGLNWSGAATSIWFGQCGDPFSLYKRIFSGSMGPLTPNTNNIDATVALLGPEAALANANILSLTYAGTGGAEGPSTMLGNLKPLAFGACTNIAPTLINSANQIYQVHGYGSCSINQVYEAALSLGAPKADVADYATLYSLALDGSKGEWATCTAQGLFRLGAQPTGVITADIGATTTVGGLVGALLALAGVPASLIDPSVSTALRGYSLYQTEQGAVLDAIKEAALNNERYLIADTGGKWHLASAVSTASPGTLKGDRSTLPLVLTDQVKKETSSDPAWRLKVGHTRVWTVLSNDQVAGGVAQLGADLTALTTQANATATTVFTAQADATYAKTRLLNQANPGVLDQTDKLEWIHAVQSYTAQKNDLINTANNLNVTTEATAYVNAYNALINGLNSLSPAWTDLTQPTNLTVDINALEISFLSARQALVNANSQRAQWALVNGGGKPQDNATVGATAGVNLSDGSGNTLTTYDIKTNIGISKDTSNVNGVPSTTITTNIAANAGLISDLQTNTIPSINSAIAAAKSQASSDLAQARSDLSSATATAQAQANQARADAATVATTVSNLTQSVNNNTGAITTEAGIRATQDGVISARIESVNSYFTGTNSTLSGRIDTEALTRANADYVLSSRTSLIEAVAGNTGSTLNSNPSFSVWPDGSQLPKNWSFWDSTGTFDRSTSSFTVGSYMLRQTCLGGVVHQGVLQNVYVSAGWYVLDAQIWLASGSAENAGVWTDFGGSISFRNDADINGATNFTTSGVKRYSKLVQTNTSGAVNIYAMNAWDGFGTSNTPGKDIFWLYVGIRAASDAEIQAGKATPAIAAAVARIATEETTRASNDSALSSRIDTVNSNVGSNFSTIQGQITTLTNTDSTLSQRLDNQYSDYTNRDSNTNSRINSESLTRANNDNAISSLLTILTATAQPASLNANSAFSIWDGGTGTIPNYWNDWSYGWNNSRIAGVNGRPYALNYQAPADRDTGVYQNISRGFGSFVFGCTVESDSYQGAGILFQTSNGKGGNSINFANEADSSGWINAGDGGRYKRTFSKFWTTAIDGGITTYSFYAMANWSAFGARAAKNITFHEVWVRPATASEIAAQRADANANTALAQISSESQTRADQYGSLSSTTSSLQSQYNGVRTDLNNWNNDRYNQSVAVNARVDSAYQTIADNNGAISSRVDNLSATVGNNTASINSQAGAIADYYGRTRAFMAWTANAGNGRAQIALYADQNGRGGVDIVGDVSISGNLLVGGSVTTGKVQNDAITNFASFGNGNYYYDNGGNQNTFDVDFYVDNDSKIIIGYFGQHSYSGITGNDPWNMSIYVDGNYIMGRGGAGLGTETPGFFCGTTIGPGSHHITATWSGSYYVHLANCQLTYQVAKK